MKTKERKGSVDKILALIAFYSADGNSGLRYAEIAKGIAHLQQTDRYKGQINIDMDCIGGNHFSAGLEKILFFSSPSRVSFDLSTRRYSMNEKQRDRFMSEVRTWGTEEINNIRRLYLEFKKSLQEQQT